MGVKLIVLTDTFLYLKKVGWPMATLLLAPAVGWRPFAPPRPCGLI